MFMVMSAIEYSRERGYNNQRCFDVNVLNIPTKEEADSIAIARTRTERLAGHNNVDWFSCRMD